MERHARTVSNKIWHLHAHTGIEVTLVAVRSSKEQYNWPYVLTTSDCTSDFFELTIKKNIFDLAIHMEAYLLSRVQSMPY